MKLYKIRFIVLGLLLRVFFVWCQTCGTKFTDPASSAYLAEAVVEGRVTKTMPPNDEGRYNVTLAIRRVRKGAGLLPGGKKTQILTIGEFGEKDIDSECVTSITKSNQKYFFFLKKVTVENSTFYRISAFPVSVSKQSGRLIRKAACKTCGKKPELKKIKAKNVSVGKKLQLRCRVRSARPDPSITWTKDGVPISGKTKGVQIREKKKYSQLRINKASSEDAGVYTCIATNVVGTTEKSVNIKVISKSPSKGRPRTTPAPRHIPCKPEDQGYCLNGGVCRIIKNLDIKSCACPETLTGLRCQFPNPFAKKISTAPGKSPNPERDRTLTIIGIVIGILIFVCFCIASYFLAKNRRMAYLRKRDAKKKQLNGTTTTSVYKTVDPQQNGRKLQRQNTVNMETQTDDGCLYPPYPNANPDWPNSYLTPLDNNFLRNPPSNRNSRTRLSGVSTERERPTSQPDTLSSPKPLYNRSPSDPTKPFNAVDNRVCDIPRLRVSDDSVGSDGEEVADDSTSLRISEDDERTPFVRKTFSESGRFEPGGNSINNDDETVSQSSCADDEELRRIYCADDNGRYGRRCSETLSWNERGSPEQLVQQNCFNIEDPNYLKSNNCTLPVTYDNIYNLNDSQFLDDKPPTPV